VSTQVSASTAPLTKPAPADAGRADAGAAGGKRSTSWRVYAALVVGSLVLASLTLLFASTPSYDPWGWLLWGREILHLKLNTIGSNTFKPLPVLFTLPFALFGRAQPDMWLVVARAGAVFAVAMAFKLAARITMWFGATPAGRRGIAGVVACGPAILAGVVAGLSILITPNFIHDAALGYSEALGAGLVLLAIERHLDDKPRQTFIIGFFPALDRPEVWPFWGLYGLYLWRRDPRAWKLIAAFFALVPCLWFLPELWGSGHLFRGVDHDLGATHGAAIASCPFCAEIKSASLLALVRVKYAAALTALGAAITVAWALRHRSGSFRDAVREQSHRPAGVVLALALTAILWFVEISAMTQYGFSGNERYLIIGLALVDLVAGIGWGVAAWKIGQLLARAIRPAPGAAVAVAAAAGLFLFFGGWVARYLRPRAIGHTLSYQAELRRDVSAIIGKAGGAKAVIACGHVETENYQVPMVAWYLGVESVDVADQQPNLVANVIFQTRPTRTAPLDPVIPPHVHYTEIRNGTFNLFEHCRNGG
jgi:hypothetical protein